MACARRPLWLCARRADGPGARVLWLSAVRCASSSAAAAAAAAQQRRVELFEREKARAAADVAALPSSTRLLRVTSPHLPGDGTLAVPATWRPLEALKSLVWPAASSSSSPSPHLPPSPADPIVAVRVNGVVRGLGDGIGLGFGLLGGSGCDALAAASGDAVERPVSLQFLRFSDVEGRRLFMHSGAHIVGAALEAHFGDTVLLTDGPAVGAEAEGGFFYEMKLADDAVPLRVSDDLFPALEAAVRKVTALKAPFERVSVSLDAAARMFAENPYKLDVLARLADGPGPAPDISVYRCGPFVDLCRGPHVPNTGYFRALRLFRAGGSHWQAPPAAAAKGAAMLSSPSSPELARLRASGVVPRDGDLLQRVYGIAFPTPPQLDAWQHMVDEAKRRDHRVIGRAQQLFFFHDLSPGSAFLLPHGTRVYNRLTDMLRSEYRRRGYEEVRTPLIYKKGLWKTSGHLQAYAENMFGVVQGLGGDDKGEACHPSHGHSAASRDPAAAAEDGDDEDGGEGVFGLKPMNCPGHCLIFAHRQYSYRDLPVRLADFSTLHRNEARGALGGLTRLRRFAQDDAHIFCGEEHIAAEVEGCLSFVAAVYRLFGFSFRMRLSTRPEVYVGDLPTWDRAETALRQSLVRFLETTNATTGAAASAAGGRVTVDVDEGGGAFYGPKVDVFVRDAIGREHQCATVQLDFQLPRRFGLSYRAPSAGGSEAGTEAAAPAYETPVIIHRAILGSVERMFGILIEHTGGKWPFWLSPRQILVCTVADRHAPYARRVAESLRFAPTAAAAAPVAAGDPAAVADTGLWSEVDESTRSVPKKVREGQVEQWNVIAVVGDSEEAAGAVALRFRDAATYEGFLKAWAHIDPAAAAKAPVLTTSPPSAAAAPAAGGKGVKGGAAPLASAAAAGATFASPLVTLKVDEARAVCAHMMVLKL
jgi:threonyl-tRNA synthetase